MNSPIRLPKTTTASATSKSIGKPVLTSWLSTGNHRGKKDASREKASGHPENSELKMPSRAMLNGRTVAKVNTEEVG